MKEVVFTIFKHVHGKFLLIYVISMVRFVGSIIRIFSVAGRWLLLSGLHRTILARLHHNMLLGRRRVCGSCLLGPPWGYDDGSAGLRHHCRRSGVGVGGRDGGGARRLVHVLQVIQQIHYIPLSHDNSRNVGRWVTPTWPIRLCPTPGNSSTLLTSTEAPTSTPFQTWLISTSKCRVFMLYNY